jgi:hypothetical protein
MTWAFNGGKVEHLGNDFVEVRTGVSASFNGTSFYTNGISIKVKGTMEAHVIQVCSRRMFTFEDNDQGAYRAGKVTAPSGEKHNLTTDKNAPEFWVDSVQRPEPFYDGMDKAPWIRDQGTVTIFDQPSMIHLPTEGMLYFATKKDWSKFVARSYCVADGGLAAIVQWGMKKEFKQEPTFKVKLLQRSTENIDWGKNILKTDGYNPDLLPLKKI